MNPSGFLFNRHQVLAPWLCVCVSILCCVFCELHAYQRAAQSGYPAALGVELGCWYHRSHPPSLTPQSRDTSTFPVPPEEEK